MRMLSLDVSCFRFVAASLFARRVADVPVSKQAADHGAESGDHERRPPGVKDTHQCGDDDAAERRAQGGPAVDDHRAAAPLARGQPHRIELARRGVDGRLRQSQPEPGQHQSAPPRRQGGHDLTCAPEKGGRADDEPRPIAVGEPSRGHLGERVGPEEAAEDDSLRRGIDPKFAADRRHGHRQRRTVDVIDGDDEQHKKKNAPTGVGFFRRRLKQHLGADRFHPFILLVVEGWSWNASWSRRRGRRMPRRGGELLGRHFMIASDAIGIAPSLRCVTPFEAARRQDHP